MTEEKPITYDEAMRRALAQVDGPIAVEEFIARVLTIRPSKAKKAATKVRNTLRWEHAGRTVAFLDRKTIVPLRIAMRGVRFRIPVTRQETKRGVLFIDPGFHHFLRQGTAHEDVQLLDDAGQALAVRVVVVKQTREGRFGPFTYEAPAFDLGGWFRAQRMRRDDSVLVTIEDWQKGHFRLEHEPARQRRQQEIELKNQELSDLVFDILEAEYDEQVFAIQAIPTAYVRLSDPKGYPGDHWIEVIARDPRMASDGLFIRYSDFRPLLEVIAFGEEGETLAEEPPTPAQARQVYRFKAALRYRPGLWRRIEIQGGQTLADFDSILRHAFEHDPVDHLSGFWKRIRRGTGKRFREVDLGDIHPFGGGSGAERHLAAMGLEPGDQLKYVFDFGDWIEHRITLEEIVEPEAGAEYPRLAGQNKPRYAYCESCEAKGRKTIATWICFDCSNEQEHNILVCEYCLMQEHEEHWANEILY
jgi:hypothetical protein